MLRSFWINTKSVIYTIVVVAGLGAIVVGGVVLVPLLLGIGIILAIFGVFKAMQD
jgi:hypothetical protein